MNRLNQPIEQLPRTSPITIKKLKTLDIHTIWDLLNYFPYRYEDYSVRAPIVHVRTNQTVTIQGTVTQAKQEYTKRGLKVQKIIIADETGEIPVVWYNQPYLLQVFRVGIRVSIAGEIKRFLHTTLLDPKEYEILYSQNQQTIHTGRIVPVYSETRGISTKTIREKMFFAINQLQSMQENFKDMLPEEIVRFNRLVNQVEAYEYVHFPANEEMEKNSRTRLAFDELFVMQLSAALIKKQWHEETAGHAFVMKKKEIEDFIAHLPFQLTNAQKKVLDELFADLVKPYPMNRFLQGDVGSGKTVVAAIACYLAHLNGCTSLFMAPTEILAAQHYETLSKLLSPFGIRVSLVTGKKEYKVSSIKYDVIIGTHAILNEKLSFNNVGLVVIDEQHRFGVAQRAQLKEKGIYPHLLTMTATPIPRTVALTLYGELDLSVIDEMPVGRIPIKTFAVPKHKRADGYAWIQKKIKEEHIQAFIICPLIEASEEETMKSVKAASLEYEHLKKDIFPNLRIGLLHGKMKSKEKDAVMEQFRKKEFDILVSTSVVEVGIDIPNAAIMIIEGAERFGLAQLHQLRGRVGRGDKQSYCFLFSELENEEILNRLKFFARSPNGIELSKFDFKKRGPGELFGTRQHGYMNLKIASYHDYPLIKQTKSAAEWYVKTHGENLSAFPELKKRVEHLQVEMVGRD